MTSSVRDAYTPAEAAKRLGVGHRTVLRLIREGKLGAIDLGRTYLVPVEEITRFLAPAIKTDATTGTSLRSA